MAQKWNKWLAEMGQKCRLSPGPHRRQQPGDGSQTLPNTLRTTHFCEDLEQQLSKLWVTAPWGLHVRCPAHQTFTLGFIAVAESQFGGSSERIL